MSACRTGGWSCVLPGPTFDDNHFDDESNAAKTTMFEDLTTC